MGWTSLPSMSHKRHLCSSVVDSNGNAYVLGGDSYDSGKTLAHCEYYDGSSWNSMPSMNTAREGFAAGIDSNDNIYVAGGGTAEKYNGSSWTNINNLPQSLNNNAGGINPVTGDFYTVAGDESPEVYKWDGSSWSYVTDHPNGGVYGHSVVFDSNGFLYSLGGSYPITSDVHKWDGSSWTMLPSMSRKRYNFGAGIDSNDNIFVAGGEWDFFEPHAEAEVYDGSSWISIDSLPSKTANISGAVGQNNFYVMGGENVSPMEEVFDIPTSPPNAPSGLSVTNV